MIRLFWFIIFICCTGSISLAQIGTSAPVLSPKEGVDKRLPSSPVTKAETEKYYLNCVNNVLSLSSLNPYQRDYLCSCVSAGLPVALTSDELKSIESDILSSAGQAATNRFLNDIYMPCATPLLKETIWSECIERAQTSSHFSKTAIDRCNCLSKSLMSYLLKIGVHEAEYNLEKSKQFTEPFDILIGMRGFSEERSKHYMACFDGMIP